MDTAINASGETGNLSETIDPAFDECQLLTVDEFRRRYFSERHRPSRAKIRAWIQFGTADGVFLPGYKIEGKFYVDAELLPEFFSAYRNKTRDEANKPRRSSAKARAQRALSALKSQYNIG